MITAVTEGRMEYTITIEGTTVPSHIGVLEIEVENEVNRIPTAYLVLSDGATIQAIESPEQRNRDIFRLGKQITVSIDQETQSIPVFNGVITNFTVDMQEGLTTLSLECKHPVYRMTLRTQNRIYRQQTDQQVLEQLTQLYNLETQIETTEYTHPELVQQNLSDWDFMIMRLEANGLYATFTNSQLIIDRPDFNGSDGIATTLSYEREAISFKGELAVQHQFEEVSMRSWDSDQLEEENQEQLSVESDADNVLGLPGERNNQEGTIAEINHPDHDSTGNASQLTRPYVLRSGTPMPISELQARANAKQLRNRLSQKTGQIKLSGYRSISVGEVIELRGFASDFNGKVYVSKVRYYFHQGLWLQYISFGLCPKEHAERYQVTTPKANGIVGAIQGLQIGVVQQIHEDPDNAYRIKVRIPVMDEEIEDSGTQGGGSETQEGIWARLTTLDAGLGVSPEGNDDNPGRGTFFMPEIGDEVVIGFIDEDPRFPIILGMLYSDVRIPAEDFLPAEANPKKGLVTRNGLKLLFQEDDDVKSITLETPASNTLRISETDDDGGFDLSDQHGNRILMNSEGITIQSIGKLVLKADQDIEQEAGSNWKAKGTQGKLDTSGTLDIKGAMININ